MPKPIPEDLWGKELVGFYDDEKFVGEEPTLGKEAVSARPNVHVSMREPADSPPSPNATVAAITAEIRVFYPPGQLPAAMDLMERAYIEAHRKLRERAAGQPDPVPYPGP